MKGANLDPGLGSAPPSSQACEAWRGPLFIVGMPRSGTKLLRGLLGRHPRIRIPDIETSFLPFLIRWVSDRGPPHKEEDFRQLFQALRHGTYFRLRRDLHPFVWQEWRALCDGRFDASGLFEGFIRYETGLPRSEHAIWGDKSPAYIRFIEELLQHFPEARIVHIVRDVRDYCASVRKAWSKDLRRAASHWARDVARAHRACETHAQRCIQLRYEDLLAHPEREVARVAAFLGLEFRTEMTHLERPAEVVGEAAGSAEIVRDNAHKFERHLTRNEITSIEELAFTTMRALGYEPMHARRQVHLSSFGERLLRIKDGFSLLKGRLRNGSMLRAIRFHLNHARMSH